MSTFACPYCPERLPTAQGRLAHIRQVQTCKEKDDAAYASLDWSSDDNLGPALVQDNAPADPMDVDDPPASDALNDFGGIDPQITADDPVITGAGSPQTGEKRRRVTVEEVEDEGDGQGNVAGPWVEDFPEELRAGEAIRACKTEFQRLREDQKLRGESPWFPFKDIEEWELARWLVTSGLTQSKTEEFLKLKAVRRGIQPSFHNNRAFLQRVDMLPRGPKWHCRPFELTGDELDADGQPKKQLVELWYRDILDCIRELLSDPTLPDQAYEPLTRFSGDQQAWPMYIGIGNVDADTRSTPSARAMILLGYIPVTKLETFRKENRSATLQQLFHDCVLAMLDPLIAAGEKGVEMECVDGFIRLVFVILAAYIADYPEQCMIACCRENSCPICLVKPQQRGDLDSGAPRRDQKQTLTLIEAKTDGDHPPEFITHNLNLINPFWRDLPHCSIFDCFTPDLLHEIHNGVFGNHLVEWVSAAMKGLGPEMDRSFQAMTLHPSLRHFKKGITLTTQWTGKEHKEMAKVLLGIAANAADPKVLRAVRGVIDFTYYAHFRIHTDESLALMDLAWRDLRYEAEFISIDQDSPAEAPHTAEAAVPPDPGSAAAAPTAQPHASTDSTSIRHMIAKNPSYPNVPVSTIISDFQAPDFLFRLDDYTAAESIPYIQQPTLDSTFPLYKRLSVDLPRIEEVTKQLLTDKIRSVKPEPQRETPKGIKAEKAGIFDTVLVRVPRSARAAAGELGILRPARVRILFRVPDEYACVSETLAYIEWYTELQRLNMDVGMYEVKPSTRSQHLHSEIIPVKNIVHSCHLIPVFGPNPINAYWGADHILDQCPKFYLNPYLRHHDFYLLRYLPALAEFRRQEVLRRAKQRQLGRAARFIEAQ
ncbi:hypothetical protein HMN09_00361800 [Mycena chlorophos]|uniref:Uncharacterized protein n=1 Tax=Mycena chlorophos TaxID=658473 RepID=A0A8H6WN79_MYCCL|nr:hypothetical protein HMN09_00361800 [Mycena chlorophos]